MALRIAMGAGHGVHTPGKRCAVQLDPKQTKEWTLNNRIVNYVEEGLKEYEGVTFLRLDDRTGQRDVPLKERVDKANRLNADIVISVHHDAGANLTTAGGITVYIANQSSANSKVYQKALYNSLIKTTGLKGNRASPLATANFYIVRYTKAPAVLVEHGFMDSRTDVPIILSDKFARDAARGHIEFLEKQFKLKKKAGKPTPKELYRVRLSWDNPKSQKGAYAVLDNAIEEAKSNPGYIVYNHLGKEVYPGEKPRPKPEENKTAITGQPKATYRQMAKLLLDKNPKPKIKISAEELAKLFIEEGIIEGIRGDIAFCQSMHETGWLGYGGQVLPEQNNYSGIGATNNSPVGKGAWFETERIGVQAQIQHLKAYANKEPLKQKLVDPRFHLVKRGIAPNWTDLNGKWAVPGPTYGQSVLLIYDELLKVVVQEEEKPGENKELIDEIEKLRKELAAEKDKINKIKDIIE